MKTPDHLHHTNNGMCPKCHEIIDRYHGINTQLLFWFTGFQSRHPEFHVSCAGRGQIQQEVCFSNGSSKAHWLESAHNFNCALDLFIDSDMVKMYDSAYFHKILGPEITFYLEWYGAAGAVFYELPHLQIKNWRDLKLPPVE